VVLFNSGGGGDKHISEVQNVAQIDIPTECKMMIVLLRFSYFRDNKR